MRKIIILLFFVLTFTCSCTDKKETAADWINKEQRLWNGQRYTNPQKAIEYLDKAINLQKNNAETYNKRGIAYFALRDYAHTIADNNEAIRLKPDYIFAYNNRGIAYVRLGQYKPAIEDCNQVIRLKPDWSQAYINRGTVHLLLGEKKLGCLDYKKACSLGNCKSLELAKGKGFCY